MKNSSAFLHTSKTQIKTTLKFYLNSEWLSSRKQKNNKRWQRCWGKECSYTIDSTVNQYGHCKTTKNVAPKLKKKNDHIYSCPTPGCTRKKLSLHAT